MAERPCSLRRIPLLRTGARLLTRSALAVVAAVVALAVSGSALAAQATGTISGTVLSPATGPVSGAQVQAFAAGRVAGEAVTGESGTFRITGLEAGRYALQVRALGYSVYRDTVDVAAGQTVQLTVALRRSVLQLDQVVTTVSRAAESAFEAPASVNVVNAEQIEERPALTTIDNLRSVPGIDISQGGLVQSNVVTRGFNNAFSGALLTLIDYRFASVPSLRVNVPFLFSTPNEDVERVEVLLGPAAALYGPNSANGVLHVITKSPFESQGTTVTLDAGERSVVRGALRHAGTFTPTLGYKISGEYMQGNEWEYHDPAEPPVFPNTPNTPGPRIGQPNARDFDVQKYGGEARLDWQFAENAEWINTYGVSHAASAIELTGANGTAQVKGWTIQSFQSRLRAGRFFAQAFMNLSNAGNEDSLDLGGTYLLRTGQPIVDQSRTFAAQAQHGFDLGERQSFSYGVDYIRTDPRTGGTINGRNEDDDLVNEIGGYIQSQTALSPRWDLLLAARVDHHDRMDGTFFSPRAAIIFKPSETQNLRFTYNRAFSTPANFSLFLDLLQAGNVGGLPYNVRALGVPAEGFTFRRDCAGGVASLCMRSPFAPGDFIPANAAAMYPAALNVMLAGGLQDQLAAQFGAGTAAFIVNELQNFNAVGAGVGTNLVDLVAQEAVSPASVQDVERLKASFTNVFEVGYKGIFGSKFRLAVDGWYQQRENFITPAVNFTPNALLDGQTLGAALAAHLAPSLGAANAAALAEQLTPVMARIPLGTVVPDSRLTTNADIAFTYMNIDETIDLYGADVAFDWLATDALTVLGTYSWVSDVVFPKIQSGALPLTLNAPDHKASLTFRYDYRPQNVGFELRGRYQNTFPVNSAVFVSGIDLPLPGQSCEDDGTGCFQYQKPPTATFLDAQVTWRFPWAAAQNALISVNATNLLNNEVPSFAGVPPIGRMVMTRLQVTF
jgi:outer membrane receptor for ferrienterochelin and colicins